MSVQIVTEELGVADLRARLAGEVYVPGEGGYEAARQAWNRIVDQSPRLIVDAETVGDVQEAVRYARANGLPIGVMATGHGTPRGCDGLLIRTARMNAVRVDPETRMAFAQGGALVRDVQAASAPFGLAMLGGSSTGVGVVGYTLGGGYSLMQRKYGLAVDRVKGATLVTPDGNVVKASMEENPDLFWAIRGGGGAFGVIVELAFELVEQATVFGGATIYPVDDADAIVRAWTRWTEGLPEEVTSALLLMNLPPLPSIPEPLRGRAVVMINACVCGDLADAEATIAPMRTLGTPTLDHWGAMPVTATDVIYNDPTDPMPAVVRGATLAGLDDAAITRMMAAVGPMHTMPQVFVQLRHIGGAMARMPRESTPITAGRDARYLAYCVGVPNPFATPEVLDAHASGVIAALSEAVLQRGPLNFLGEASVCSRQVRGVYGDTEHGRLCAVKRAVDPHNAFRFASVGLD